MGLRGQCRSDYRSQPGRLEGLPYWLDKRQLALLAEPPTPLLPGLKIGLTMDVLAGYWSLMVCRALVGIGEACMPALAAPFIGEPALWEHCG